MHSRAHYSGKTRSYAMAFARKSFPSYFSTARGSVSRIYAEYIEDLRRANDLIPLPERVSAVSYRSFARMINQHSPEQWRHRRINSA